MNNNMYISYNIKVLKENNSICTSLDTIPKEYAKILRQADPVVWPIWLSTTQIVNELDLPWDAIRDDVGMIVVGNAYPKHYTEKIIDELNVNRRVSPVSFINANAGSGISMCCTTHKFHGPTINYTISDDKRHKIALTIANYWLSNNSAKYIFYITSDFNTNGECVVENRLITNM